MRSDAFAVASAVCLLPHLALLTILLTGADAADALVFDHWEATMAVLIAASVPASALWWWMLADAIRRQFILHSPPAKLWHVLLLLVPHAAFVYYLVEWRPRALRRGEAPDSTQA